MEPRSVTEQRPAGEPSSSGQSGNYTNNQSSYQNQSGNQANQNQNKAPQSNQNNFSFNQDFNQQASSPFMEDGRPIDISEDDLPF